MDFIAVLNSDRFEKFIRSGVLSVRSSEKSTLNIMKGDLLYVQNDNDGIVYGPFTLSEYSNSKCFVTTGNDICRFKSDTIYQTGPIDSTVSSVFDSSIIKQENVGDSLPLIADDPYLTGFILRSISFSIKGKCFQIDLSKYSQNIVEDILFRLDSSSLDSNLSSRNKVVFNNPSQIPLKLLLSSNNLESRQSNEFMDGYLTASCFIGNPKSKQYITDAANFSLYFSVPSKSVAITNYLEECNYFILPNSSTNRFFYFSPLNYGNDVVRNVFSSVFKEMRSDLNQIDSESSNDPSSGIICHSISQKLKMSIIKESVSLIFSYSGFDVEDNEEEYSFKAISENIYYVKIISNEADAYKPVISDNVRRYYLRWDGSILVYYRLLESAGSFKIESGQFINSYIPNLKVDLISLLNDYLRDIFNAGE